MIENLVTTKMSGGKKTIEERFNIILGKNNKTPRFLLLMITLLLSMSFILTNVTIASTEDINNYKLKVYFNNEEIKYLNKPILYDETVYIPLRETIDIVGLLDTSKIMWDNGIITISIEGRSNNYKIEIGKPYIAFGLPNTNLDVFTNMETNAYPLLVNDNTYIPFEYVDLIINNIDKNFNLTYSYGNIKSNNNSLLYQNTSIYLKSEFIRVFGEYYDIKNLVITNWNENGNKAVYLYNG